VVPAAKESAMKYENTVIKLSIASDKKRQKVIDEMNGEGWELVALSSIGAGSLVGGFRRPVS
jgi:hypothetical protein